MDLSSRAREFARQAYRSDAELAHPLEVAALVEGTGAPDELVAVAVLHDTLEDTDVQASELAAAFGARITALVGTLTEDEAIGNYRARKADLRARACAAGPDAGLIFVADKLSNARRMRRGEKDFKERKVAHYEATLALFRSEHPGVPLLDQLGHELRALRASRQVPA
jgi:guanosine-3',5'-bis(diphosphate) 3'-pyrophosphohydrolase